MGCAAPEPRRGWLGPGLPRVWDGSAEAAGCGASSLLGGWPWVVPVRMGAQSRPGAACAVIQGQEWIRGPHCARVQPAFICPGATVLQGGWGVGGFRVSARERCLTCNPNQTKARCSQMEAGQAGHFPPLPVGTPHVSLPSSLPVKIQLMSNPPGP